MNAFNDFNISDNLRKAIADMSFEEPTAIQKEAIPVALNGRDIIGQAQTGTGKTAAFGIPLLEKCRADDKAIQGLIITPTRELAVQVAEELNSLGHYKRIKALPIYGGQNMERQIKALKNRPQIIVATPGRLMDHIRRKLIRLNNISTVVLDEADEMLNMGFREDIEEILSGVPDERQTLLFSATMPPPIRELALRYMHDPEFITIKATGITVPNTEQYYYKVHEKDKFDTLCRLLDLHSPDAAIVFARTKRRVDEIFEALSKRGYSAEAIHGDLTQSKRDSVMRKFKKRLVEILVATDVAARGLDIGSVTHIYNFDIPQDPESYVHRIGRTGRIGRSGVAATLVQPRELNHLELIERIIKRKIIHQSVPTLDEAIKGQQRLAAEKILQIVEKEDYRLYKETARELLESNSATSLLAAALKMLVKEPDSTPVSITADQNWQPKKKQPQRRNQGNSYKPRQTSSRTRSGYKKYHKNKKTYNK